jgi:hypothetical protein
VAGVPPPSDDEVERRLAALKAGADPSSFGPPPGDVAPPPAAADRSAADRSAADEPPAARRDPMPAPVAVPGMPDGPSDGGAGEAPPEPALVGEVIDGEGGTWSSRPFPGASAGPGPSGGGPAGTGTRLVSWSLGQAEAGRLGLWIGVGLVAFGAYLVLAEIVPGVATLGSLALAVVGGALLVLRARGRAGAWALYVGAIVAGFGGLRLIADVAGLPPAGWGTLGAGLGLLAIALLRAARGGGAG